MFTMRRTLSTHPPRSRSRGLALLLTAAALGACTGSDENIIPDDDSDVNADALGDVDPGTDAGDQEVAEPDSALPDIVEADAQTDTDVASDITDVVETDIADTTLEDTLPDIAEVGVDADIAEALPSSCATVAVNDGMERRIEMEADPEGRYLSGRLLQGGAVRQEIAWEYDSFGRETLQRETTYDDAGAVTRVWQQRREWSEAPPSAAGTIWREDDDDADGALDFVEEAMYDEAENVVEFRQRVDGALNYEVHYLTIYGTDYTVYEDEVGAGTSPVSVELVGEMPVPTRVTIVSPEGNRQLDFTWDSEGRLLEKLDDFGADGFIDGRFVVEYPADGVTEETFYANENPVAGFFRRRVVVGEDLQSEHELTTTDCSFSATDIIGGDDRVSEIREGAYTTPTAECLEINRNFPEENYARITESTLTRCGTALLTTDSNADGTVDLSEERTWDDDCNLLTEYVKNGSPGFEERALRLQGTATYTPEGWLTSLVVESFSSAVRGYEVTQTWDERGNQLSRVYIDTFSENTTARTYDSANRELTREETLTFGEGETFVFTYTYIYDGDWPESTCLDSLPTEGDK